MSDLIDKRRLIYGKYRIEKMDWSPIDPKAVYLILRPDMDSHAREALRAYAASCREESPDLAADLERMLEELADKQEAK